MSDFSLICNSANGKMRTVRLFCESLIIVGMLSAMPRQISAAASCLRYDLVNLTGTVVRQTYAGPPDYESVTKGDEPIVIWVLLLEQSICVDDPDPRYPREYYEREVQLIMPPDRYAAYKKFLGKKVIASGRLQHGGARYDKPLVLMVDEMRRTRV